MSESVFENSAYLDQVTDSQYMEEDYAQHQLHRSRGLIKNDSLGSPMSTPKASMIINPTTRAEFNTAETRFENNSNVSSDEDEEDELPTPIPEEDLTRSLLFSHEEAESMYMSAVSHTSSLSWSSEPDSFAATRILR
ncbi:putative Autophagy-related protein 2 [Glarea lozoyensis 74030]|uniref:Putative Autophagy-related protein 2 n=1 Tax=Glarea lozoyensis (strain ATCC 74030 / MF5533) TaxID=1104152 RepID=H0ET44_GLAL7|nr:putative Autophagy-related protein 2 [Glarea lozoyensis 74030]